MRKLFVFVATVVAGLALAGVAQAGCMATVGLSSMPKPGQQAGTPWVVTIRVLQHGRTPMPDAKPEVRIRNAAGKLFTFKAKRTGTVGSYRARVVFPKAGRYKLGVYDGFPFADCARVHTFKSVLIVGV
jgi:YtkA-like protein